MPFRNRQMGNGDDPLTWLHFMLERLDHKLDLVHRDLGAGTAIMEYLQASDLQQNKHLAQLQDQITRIQSAHPSRMALALGHMREVMPLKEWLFGLIFVAVSLLGLQMPAEVRQVLVSVLTRAAGGG